MSNIDDKLNEVLNIAEEVLEKKEEKNPLEIVKEPPVPVVPEEPASPFAPFGAYIILTSSPCANCSPPPLLTPNVVNVAP